MVDDMRVGWEQRKRMRGRRGGKKQRFWRGFPGVFLPLLPQPSPRPSRNYQPTTMHRFFDTTNLLYIFIFPQSGSNPRVMWVGEGVFAVHGARKGMGGGRRRGL